MYTHAARERCVLSLFPASRVAQIQPAGCSWEFRYEKRRPYYHIGSHMQATQKQKKTHIDAETTTNSDRHKEREKQTLFFRTASETVDFRMCKSALWNQRLREWTSSHVAGA